MKYLILGFLFLTLACSSKKQTPSNAAPGNTQQSNAERYPLNQNSATPAISPGQALNNSGTKGSAESHYITFSGVREVRIIDGQGNDNGPISPAYQKSVPGVSETVIGAESIQIITPTDNSYTMQFKGTGSSIAIEDTRGTTNELSDAKYIVRYDDLVIPDGRAVELRIVNDRVESLKQDMDGDGTPETVIAPSRAISDPQSADTEPPAVTVKWGPVSPEREATVVAVDSGSGVKRIFYKAGDGDFKVIDSGSVTVTVPGGPSWSIQIAAEDNAGNRSYVRTYTSP